jgi:hypothetical protein
MENHNREDEKWTIFKIKDYLDRIQAGALKEAREKKGIVYAPIWDFIEPEYFMFPQLHVEIGLVNKVVENFYDFIEAQVEAATPEQKVARNNVIIATRSLELEKERLAAWRQNGPRSLMALRAERQQVNAQLHRGENIDLLILKNNLETQIDQLMDEKKLREKTVSTCKKELSGKLATLKAITEKKSKIEKPIHAELELLLSEYNISAAAYHGGKLNGVDCRRFMHHASSIFSDVLTLLLQSENPDRCTDEAIKYETELHRDIAIVLDTICSRLRKKTGEATLEDFDVVEASVANLNYLWSKAQMSFTPKLHGTLHHALDHMKRHNGFGDMLEDDVEHMHQIAAKIEARVSRMKNKKGQANVHSKMEAMQNSREVREATDRSIALSRRFFKNKKASSLKEVKEDREKIRMETLQRITMIRVTRSVGGT